MAGSGGAVEALPPPARPGPQALPLSSRPVARGAQGGVLWGHWGWGEGHGTTGGTGTMSGADGGLGMPSAASSPHLQPQLSTAHTPTRQAGSAPTFISVPPMENCKTSSGRREEAGARIGPVPPHRGWLVSIP